ncbi:hypothetical protein CRYUN_Cryun10bG0131600 [Craigia yunnanensis]
MGKVKGKHRLDKYYQLAKEHGYRSRASWKLVQLDSKFSFLNSAHAVLDLCAAPGGWMQVAVQRVPVGSLVLGLDLVPIAPIRGAIALQQDITKSESWAQEAMSQNALVIDSVKLATQFLAPKGTFVTKLFEKVEVDKPAASRSASAEIYVLGLRYKAPAKIDPRLLDFKHLFQGSIESQKKVIDVLRVTKQKRHRDGYEDGETISKKVSTAADFIWSDSPLEILGSVTSISFEDPASLHIRDHSSTTEEVKTLCDDLRVLGKQDFKYLLKWRMQLRKALSPSEKATSSKTATDVDKGDEENEVDKLLDEMEELTYAMERKKKRAKKLLAKRQAKDVAMHSRLVADFLPPVLQDRSRKATGMQIDALEDGYTDHELFSLSSIKGNKDLVAIDSTEYDDGNSDLRVSDDEENQEKTEDESSSDIDSDEERRRYDEQIEGILDMLMNSTWPKRMEAQSRGSVQNKPIPTNWRYETLIGGDGDDIILSDHDSDKDEADPEANPLMVPLDDGEGPTQEEITNRWFGQDIFAEAVEQGDLGKYDSRDEMEIDNHNEGPPVPENAKASKSEDDVEIVPATATATDSSDDSSSDESEDEDIDTKAEILACLPKWFLEEERRHRQPNKPVTKEEIAAMRAQFKEINARPAKKVAEAKARKKRVAMKKLEKVRQKANSISDQPDISERSKNKQIEQLYKKATPKKAQREYVVAKKGVRVKAGKGIVLVDRRMKKDARARGKGKQGKGGSKKGKNGKVGKGSVEASGRKGNKGKKGGHA